jgi:uncharacterized protein (DUF4213/DUF364 family)
MITGKLVSSVAQRASAARVVDVRIGLGYTGVLLEDGHAGLAYTFRDQAQPGCNAFDTARPLAGKPAAEVLAMLDSEDAIAAGVALACVNALTNRSPESVLAGDILDHLDLRADDRVGMVGQFRPLLAPLRERAAELTVFERIPEPDGGIRPAHEATETLPNCQVALITATSIINHTIDGLLAAVEQCREVVVLGASTPLVPTVFDGTPVTMLSGVVVREPEQALRVVSEGGGMRTFRRYCDKVCLRC